MLTITVLGNTLTGDSIAELRLRFCEHRDDNFYGASDIGARFDVMRDGTRVGVLSYNGKYTEEAARK